MRITTTNTNGGAVFWKAGPSVRSRFAGLEALGLEAFIPPQRTSEALLHDALSKLFAETDQLVRRLADPGAFTVVQEVRGKDKNQYPTLCTVKMDDKGVLDVESPDPLVLKAQITTAMREAADLVTAQAVTVALVKLVHHCGGIALRPAGAVYWLLDERLEQWSAAAPIFEHAAAASGGTVVYLMKTVADPGAIDAVCDALATDTANQIAQLQAEIEKGELGPTALRNRSQDIETLRKRMSEYETALGANMGELAKQIEDASNAMALAIVAASARAEELKAARKATP